MSQILVGFMPKQSDLKARVWSKDSKGRSRTDVHGWSQQFAAPFTYSRFFGFSDPNTNKTPKLRSLSTANSVVSGNSEVNLEIDISLLNTLTTVSLTLSQECV